VEACHDLNHHHHRFNVRFSMLARVELSWQPNKQSLLSLPFELVFAPKIKPARHLVHGFSQIKLGLCGYLCTMLHEYSRRSLRYPGNQPASMEKLMMLILPLGMLTELKITFLIVCLRTILLNIAIFRFAFHCSD